MHQTYLNYLGSILHTMITRRAYTALSLAERQVIQSQYAGSGQCVRCFHHARRQQADELRPEDGSPAIKDSAKRAENNGILRVFFFVTVER